MERVLLAIAICFAATAAFGSSRWHCEGAAPRHLRSCQDYAARYVAYREAVEQRKQEYADRKKLREAARTKRRVTNAADNSVEPGKPK